MTAAELAVAGYHLVSSSYFRQAAEIRLDRYRRLGISAAILYQPRLEGRSLGRSWDVWTATLLPGDVPLSHDIKEITK